MSQDSAETLTAERSRTTAPLLEVSDLRVSFPGEEGRVDAVRGVNFTVNDGEVLAIVGESGSGKSVSSMAVIGLLPEQARVQGSIRLRGRELLGLGDKEMSKLRGSKVSMVFQDPLSALTPVYRIGDQIAEALLAHKKMSKQEAAAKAVELLDLVGIPDAAQRAKAFPHEFSGGMRQRVVIAMAIANDPELIICDEPTTALDVTVQKQILNLLRKARDITGAGVIFITHDMGIAATLADRVAVMYAGRIVESAPAQELFTAPRMPYTVGLLGSIPRMDGPARSPLIPIVGTPPAMHALPPGCSFAPRCPVATDDCRAAEPPLQDTGPGHRAACIRTSEVSTADLFTAYRKEIEPPDEVTAVDAAQVVMRVTDLRKTFPIVKGVVFQRKTGEVKAVDGISFEVRAGRTLALVGESGSGKSTTLTQIMDLVRPESGSIEILGHDVTRLTNQQRRDIRRKMQIVFQDPSASLDPRLPISDALAEPLRIDGRSRDEINRRVPQLLEQVGLRPEHADRYPADFSGGQKQRINIARALALDPELLVLDEPVSSLDVSIQAGVLNLLRDLQAERGLSYLFVSHDLSVVRNLAHDIAVMYRGQIVEYGPAERIFASPEHEYTRALIDAVPVPVATR
ncbi:ABC transporter ATP-binding protein [Nocardia seriolae]|uniref:Peptide import ATP-binding protein n=1 Tax=Nocardia seriolae TaxID=37332 RepID=A0ABC8AL20_9NOCA|nr:ABC transporter ATP-binding protein [Nocardia seriolae]APA94822.1 Putative peptide import ATP-binding protein [Nocardia seriolae]MTJ60115.1 dipeptide ABC transporter ATP-binding protein [Nocardia seriolae]MTJ74385.1 dipeptide ABC transporter ATP-binding protein [Nocardia seriolae]MTJ85115.1 dipeptide ABC transporter ATP-binding protein [Nocardia seriolae]MTK29108.1 dipeptide ABC transporter ATP-binding protein [Nocardia seriolae]